MNQNEENIPIPVPLTPLEYKRRHLPLQPGVYIFRNVKKDILYIGKAKNLKARVNSYWRDRSKTEDPIYSEKIIRLRSKIEEIDITVVHNEFEAILLENELIKQYQPPFNVMLRDSKSYPWVQISSDKFPRIRIIRGPERYGKNHKYIGPFVEGGRLKELLKTARKIFPYCSCETKTAQNSRVRPCINYQIGLCPAPCCKKITQQEYTQNIQNIEKLLNGDIGDIREYLETRMNQAAENRKYEDAAQWRDRMKSLEIFTRNQSILFNDPELEKYSDGISLDQPQGGDLDLKKGEILQGCTRNPRYIAGISEEFYHNRALSGDFDVIAGKMKEDLVGLLILHVRQGRVIDKTPYIVEIKDKLLKKEDFFPTLIKQHYFEPDVMLPNQIILAQELTEKEIKILSTIFQKQDRMLEIREAKEDDKTAGLVRIATKNIELLLRQKKEYEEHFLEISNEANYLKNVQNGLGELMNFLNLSGIPHIIEGYDMSHTQGTDYVGSKVCLRDGIPDKSQYRRYKILDPSIKGSDDIKAMHEVMQRRFTRAISEQSELPDLIVVDGGVPQLNMADKLLQELGLEQITHIGIVKPPGRSETYVPPSILLPNSNIKLSLSPDSPALQILQRIRDESHRFAIEYHRLLRRKRQRKSVLDDIAGIGLKRKTALLKKFKGPEALRGASLKDLAEIVGEKLAIEIFPIIQERLMKLKEHFKKVDKKKQSERKRIIRKSMLKKD